MCQLIAPNKRFEADAQKRRAAQAIRWASLLARVTGDAH